MIITNIVLTRIYFSYNQFIEAKKLLKGEDGMNERLEEIFSELYIEYVNELKGKKLEKTKNKKLVNKKTKSTKRN